MKRIADDVHAVRAYSLSAKPSVLLITGGMDCGGAQRVMSDMANYWVNRGWYVTLATWSGPETEDFYVMESGLRRVWLDVKLSHAIPFSTLWSSLAGILKLRRLLVTSRPDVVLSFIDVSNIYTILAALGLRVRVVVSERTNPAVNDTVSRPWQAMRRLVYSWADLVVAQTCDAAEWLTRKCRATTVVIPNSLRTLPKIACPRDRLIVAVGRLSREKGLDLLLEAFARIASEFPQWRLVIVGDGPQRTALSELAERLGLLDRVQFAGQMENVELWMARAGIFAHPSRREGFPNAVLEAMGMGAAVVCADCRSGPSEIIKDGINGRLVPVDDVDALARVMSELISGPEIRERLGQEASKVIQQYEQTVIMRLWEACLLPNCAFDR